MAIISVDTNILIYVFNADPAFVNAAQRVLEKAESQGAILSMIAWTEMLHGAKGNLADETLIGAYLQSFRHFEFMPVNQTIANVAGSLLGQYKALRIGDALHIATAAQAGATEFWTNDNKLVKVTVPGLQIRLLSEV